MYIINMKSNIFHIYEGVLCFFKNIYNYKLLNNVYNIKIHNSIYFNFRWEM